ncbi:MULTISPECIES: cell division protein FtsQ/DivIB [unclassified Iodidimonas]|jgi:cell division protein FtsQ|uniref:cell division protein FtsQ/DivIB n=1 Tax=unclassified Iodidimonas TaxID=2626145 RepID=UPI0024822B97|nr:MULTISPECIES: cell division protein FtsQ/DivIB [unclassified Iodidimonas]
MSLSRPISARVKAIVMIGLGLAVFLALHSYGPQLQSQMMQNFVRLQNDMGLVIRSVDVEGAVHTPDSALQEALRDVHGQTFDAVSLGALKARLEAISWVRRAMVERRLPDRLVIHLDERVPFALWQKDRILGLVDRDGVVLSHDDLARWRDLPLIVGDGAPRAAGEILEIIAHTPELARRVAALIRVGDRRWDIKMSDGILLRLPAEPGPDDRQNGWTPEQAWLRFAVLEKQYDLLKRAISLVDLRLEDRLAVRLDAEGRLLGLAEGESL